MSDDEGLDDLARFYRLPSDWSFDGEDHVISVAAYKLHIKATANATNRGRPGYVPDEYLSSLSMETTLTVADLVTAGMWERADAGGYRIRDWDAIRVTMEHLEQLRNRDELRKIWRRAAVHLEQARMALPDRRGQALMQYLEFLEHNELGLALEELAEVARAQQAPRAVWTELLAAAGVMGSGENDPVYNETVQRIREHLGKS
jgi:hypothetical protein